MYFQNEGLKRFNISLEDDSPKVEINFNVDSNDEPTDTADVTKPSIDLNETIQNGTEVDDASKLLANVEKTESELVSLQDAQEALESFKLVLKKQEANGNLKSINPLMFKVGFESIINRYLPSCNISTEMLHRPGNAFGYLALEQLDVATQQLEEKIDVTKKNWVEKLKSATNKALAIQSKLIKRADGLSKIAEATKGEQLKHPGIEVNTEESLKLRILTNVTWETDEEFIEHLQSIIDFYKTFTNDSLEEFFTNVKLPMSVIGGELKEVNDVVEFERKYGPDEQTNVITLSAVSCKTIADMLLTFLNTQDVIGDVLVDYTTNNFDTLPVEIQSILSVLNKLHNLRIKFVTETLNYLSMSLIDREIN